MSIAIQGCTGLFLILQEAFRHEDKTRDRIWRSPTLHGFLDDFWWLVSDLILCPTRIAELIPNRNPATNGACDVASAGMGSVHFVPTDILEIPILLRQQFPGWIWQHLSSYTIQNWSITNSDLELAGSIAQNNILAQVADVREKTTHNSYDNITAVFWQQKRCRDYTWSGSLFSPSLSPTPTILLLRSSSWLYPWTNQCHGRFSLTTLRSHWRPNVVSF